jgi:hypothetical protein
MTSSRFAVRFLLAACMLFCGTLYGQEKATIVGTVTDSTGSVIPSARITIINPATLASRAIQTNDAGNFVAPELNIGQYTVKVEKEGFKTYQRTGIVLNVNDTVRVDVPMQIGEMVESVTVEAESVKVQSDSGEVSDLISGKQMTQIAVNGRNVMDLATLTTGVSSDLPDFNLPIPVGSSGNLSFNGLRPEHNIWMIDGGENYDRGGGGLISVMPSLDAIAEFKMMTSNYGADFGLGSGGTVSMALKSGTRDFHGELWEFVRNDAFDANNFFANSSGTPKPELRYNTYGWNLGGPVFIPGHYNTDRRKTFFFFSQEWRKIVQGSEVFANAVPAPLRSGDFSSYLQPGGFGPIKVPQTNDPAKLAQFAAAGVTPGQPFPGNIIPDSLIDPNAKALLATGAIPLPNAPGNHFSGAPGVPINVREEILRMDHQITDKLSIMGHFIDDAILQDTPTTLWSGDTYPTIGTQFKNPSYSAVARLTYTISPSLLNELAYNYNGNRIILSPTGIFAKPSGFGVKEFFPTNADNRMPSVFLNKHYNVGYDPAFEPWYNAADDNQIRDDVSWTKGSHNFKFGGQFMRYRKNQDVFGSTQGSYSFDGTYTGDDFADFMLGFAKSYNELAIEDRGHWRTSTYAAYVTDSWRATKRLTVNLALRWEGIPHAYDVQNRMSNFYPNLYDPAQAPRFNPDGSLDTTGPGFRTVPGVPLSNIPFYLNGIGLAGKNGIPRGIVNNYWDTFAPRLGFAYDVTGQGKTVVRGGLGTFYERIQGNDVYNTGPNPPFSFSPTVNNVYFTDPSISVTNGQKAAVPIFPGSLYALAQDYKIPTSYQWSFGVQHELMPRAVITVQYVGNENTHQRIERNLNAPFLSNPGRSEVLAGTLDANRIRPYLGYAGIQYAGTVVNTDYNSLQVNFRVENQHGLTFQSAYTLSHCLDYGSGDFTSTSNPYNLKFDRGSCDLDRRHILSLNYIWDLPFFKGNQSKLVRGVLGGWELSGVTTLETGLPMTITFPGDNAGLGGGETVRPDLVGNPNNGPKSVTQWFNTAAFVSPAPLSFGSAGRNIVRGPGRDNWNLSMFKMFSGIPFPSRPEGAEIQFRAEFFNAFNHTQFHGVNTSFGGGFGEVNSTYDPRVIQLGLKFLF